MRFVRAAVAVMCVIALAQPGTAASTPAFREPVVHEGMAFPVMRTNWYSVINFRNDWHAPRMRLIGRRWRQVGIHEGNDIFAEPGTPIVAMTPGTVEQIGWTFYSGWRVGVRGTDGNYWFYAHMRRFAPGIGIGTRVQPGTVLGEVGNTGYGADPGHHDEFPPHLHLGIQLPSGGWINPYPLLRQLYRASLLD